MIQSPKSLTAVVHVRFHYDEAKEGRPRQGEVEILSKVMDQASELAPDLQEMLIKFASFVGKASQGERAEPD